MKRILFILMCVVLSTFAIADFNNDFQDIKVNSEGQRLTGPVGTLFKNVHMNIYIDQNNGEELIVGIVIKDKIISSINLEELDDPSLNVYTSESAIQEMSTAQDLLLSVKKAVAEEKITYESVGFFNKIKFAFISLFLDFDEDDGDVDDENNVVIEETSDENSISSTVDDDDLDDEEETEEDTVNVDETDEEVVEVEVEEVVDDGLPKTHVVEMTSIGFDEDVITVSVDDTVEWKNSRSDGYKNAMIIGTMWCRDVKSGIYEPESSYQYTFTQTGTCIIVDGIFTTETMKVVVEE
ncbi:hypothetical protein HOL21_02285 [Candidatus Woesearchaeota archaeon]|jgi:plastocyanin|nr:hypothetical protein [Candidatus Woesearchaeota archaeon]MBT5397019.1 hypothetical protein [Candidatus Woesearchaeota archaeon]MBT7762419.1 hypothetical protein [Candidatus Woesearchaeota archaeon]